MAQLFEFIGNHLLLCGSFAVLLVMAILHESRKGGRSVTPQEAVNMINREDAIILDVRDKKEFREGHILDAINIPLAQLAKRHTELSKHKSKPIIVTCKMGQHSASAGKTLIDAGYEVVLRMTGGMAEWQNSSMPVAKK